MAELLREGPRLILRRAAEEDMFSDISLDTAISFDETDASGTTSPGVDSIEF